MVELRRQFPGKASVIPAIRDFVRDSCRQVWDAASDVALISQLELAVSEAASNIVLHGLQQPLDETIELTLDIQRGQACVTFRYMGSAYHPESVPPPDFSQLNEGGYGLYLIQQSVDDIHFSRDDVGLCTFRIIKNRT